MCNSAHPGWAICVFHNRWEHPVRKVRRSSKSAGSSNLATLFRTAGPGRSISSYPKKEIIFAQGDDADAVFYIKKGKVKVTVVSTQGKEAVVAIQGKDEFLGEGCLTGQPRRLATATAMTECVVMRVEKA